MELVPYNSNPGKSETRISRASWLERLTISGSTGFDASKNQVEKQWVWFPNLHMYAHPSTHKPTCVHVHVYMKNRKRTTTKRMKTCHLREMDIKWSKPDLERQIYFVSYIESKLKKAWEQKCFYWGRVRGVGTRHSDGRWIWSKYIIYVYKNVKMNSLFCIINTN